MTWMKTHRDKGQTHRTFFESELPEALQHEGQILTCATVGDTFYAAVRHHDSGAVWALVIVIRRTPRVWLNFAYTVLEESMDPNRAAAPSSILDVLTPTDCSYATTWRTRCRNHV